MYDTYMYDTSREERRRENLKDIFVFCVSDFFYGLYDFHHEDELPPTCRHYWVPPLAPIHLDHPQKNCVASINCTLQLAKISFSYLSYFPRKKFQKKQQVLGPSR